MNHNQTRRQFIRGLAGLLFVGTGAQQLLACEKQQPAAKKHWKVSEWTGDDFTVGHKFRNGDVPKFTETPEKTVDFLVIGGGLAGLASAYYLRDHDVVVLEQYSAAGGHERGGSFRGIDYSYGAAYVGTIDGLYGQLYSDIGITPQKTSDTDNDFFWEKAWVHGTAGGDKNSLYSDFKRFFDENETALKNYPKEDIPSLIAGSTEMAKLDSVPFASMLTGYSPEFVAVADSICKSGSCGGTQRVSAYAGLAMLDDVSASNYVFEGGNSAIAKALLRALDKSGGDRVRTGCFVWSADVTGGKGAKVNYTDAKGEPHTIACKHLIVATPPMVAWRQLKGIDDKTRAAMMQYKFGSYLVANCLLNKPIFDRAYDNWLTPPFTISDIVTADTPYKLGGKYKPEMGSVLTVYHPWEPSTEGRSLLLEGDRTKLSNRVHDQMQAFITTLDDHLEEMVLSRWGHAIAVPSPGYYARLAKFAQSDDASFTLAHSTMHGFPCTESAIRGARYAADRALRTIK